VEVVMVEVEVVMVEVEAVMVEAEVVMLEVEVMEVGLVVVHPPARAGRLYPPGRAGRLSMSTSEEGGQNACRVMGYGLG